jgi:phenylacetic acid degradation operon negative regulatory protein
VQVAVGESNWEDSGSDWPVQASPDRVLPVGSAPALLLTVLGDLVLRHGDSVWTASLLDVMTGLGLEEQTARQALARASDAGLLISEKHGRIVRWTVSDHCKAEIEEIAQRAASLINPPAQWDGRCLIVTVTIPQHLRTVRKRLYSGLHWQGFGNPAPGLWASPHADRVEELRRLIDELGLNDHTITFTGGTLGVGLSDAEIVARAWDLDEIAARYEKLIGTFANLDPAPGDDLLFTYMALVNEYRQFPAMDPQLPENLLPDWVGRRATAMFVELHGKWSGPAHERWLEIVRETAPSG